MPAVGRSRGKGEPYSPELLVLVDLAVFRELEVNEGHQGRESSKL